MDIFDYSTAGGKNLIMSYIDKLSSAEQTYILEARRMIWQKGKAEKQEIDKVIKRAKKEGLM